MDNKIVLNGETYIREDAIQKTIDQKDVIKCLKSLDNFEYINIVQETVDEFVRNGWYDNGDISRNAINLYEKQILAIFLAVNNH